MRLSSGPPVQLETRRRLGNLLTTHRERDGRDSAENLTVVTVGKLTVVTVGKQGPLDPCRFVKRHQGLKFTHSR